MKRVLVGIVLIIMTMSLLVSCSNHQIIDLNWNFNKAVILRADGEQLVEVKNWNEYEDGAIQIVTSDGVVYYTHLNNVILINE